MAFDDDEVNTLKVTTFVSSVISTIGCIFIIVTIVGIRRRRAPSDRTASFSMPMGERDRHKSSSLLEASSPNLEFPPHNQPDLDVGARTLNRQGTSTHSLTHTGSKKRMGAAGADTQSFGLGGDPSDVVEVADELDDNAVPAAPSVMVENMQRILQWLSVSDIILGLGFFFSFNNYDAGICKLQAWLLQFGGFSCFSWTFCMALELYYILIQRNQGATRRLRLYHIAVWGLSFVSVFGLLAFDQLGPPNPPPYSWCWVVPNTYARFLPFYLPFSIVCVSCVALYAAMMRNVQHIYTGAGWSMDRRLFLRLGLYPAIFLLTWVWGLADRIQNAIDNDNPSFFLTFMHSLFTPAQGLLDAICYGLTNSVIRNNCRRIIFPFFERLPVGAGDIDPRDVALGGAGSNTSSHFYDDYDSAPTIHDEDADGHALNYAALADRDNALVKTVVHKPYAHERDVDG